MTKLNQLIAIEAGVKNHTANGITELYHQIQQPNRLAGIARTYRPKDDDGDQLPPESTLVQLNVTDVLHSAAALMTRLMDVTFTKAVANQSARADVTVDGVTLAADVPVSYLLFLEKQLTDLRTLITKLPVLDPSERWESDPNTATYRTATVSTTRTKKVPRNHVLAEATERHPAQVQVWHEDIIVGTWDTVKFSGAIPAQRKNLLLARLTAVQDAVKFAREHANTMTVIDHQIGDALFHYLLAP